MEHVLVTGGAGYIGSHACKALAEAGYCPVTIDNLCLGHREFVRWGPLIEADIHDPHAVATTIRSYNVIGVMHFAAFAYVGELVTNPAKYYENNVTGLLSLLAAMRQTNLNPIVFSSSCAVYGSPDIAPISEQMATQPVNPYGHSKLICEQILWDYASAYAIEPVALRYFNASGAEPMASIGEQREVETHLIPRAMMALQGYIDDFKIYGNDFPTCDGTAVRDYIHVGDLADAHILALRYLLAGGGQKIFNLGIGKGYSVKEVITAIETTSGQSLDPPTGKRRRGDPAVLVADARLACAELGFIPRHDLRSIISSAWRWHTSKHPRK